MALHAELLGTFWSDVYDDPTVHDYLEAKHQIERQVQQDLCELRDCTNRATTPLYHRQLFQHLTLRKSQQAENNCWQLPKNLVSIGSIANKIYQPTKIWLDKIDFVLRDGLIQFREDPFLHAEQTLTQDDISTFDAEVTWWMTDACYDANYLNEHWGAALGLSAPSTDDYRTLLCESYDAMLGGTSRAHIEQILAIMYGGTLAKADETVLLVARDNAGGFIATAQHIYRGNGIPLVLPGEQVQQGDPLFDSVTFHRLGSDLAVPAITVPKLFLDSNIAADLTFTNHDVPLQITPERVEFEVGGHADAVARFWTMLNERGGHALRVRFAGRTTINPCKFLLQEVLKYNVLICVLKSPKIPAHLTTIDQPRLLRQLIPPHEAVLFVTADGAANADV